MRGTDKMKKTDIQGENESSEIRAGSAETKKTEPGETGSRKSRCRILWNLEKGTIGKGCRF